jgi:transposase
LDAVRAAREALGQEHLANPRRRGQREALRVLLTTRRCATLARVAAIGQLNALIVGAPQELRAELRGRNTASQVHYCARLRPRPTRSLEHQATVQALRATAARIQLLQAEADQLQAELTTLVGTNPIPASFGQVTRYRLNRGGDRQLNRALHTILLVRLRIDPDTRAYVARRTAEGKSRRDAKRCLRRSIARQLFRLLERYDQPGIEILRAA